MSVSLHEIQLRFKNAIKEERSTANGDLMFAGHFDAYSAAYWMRMEESLREDFPETASFFSREDFSSTVRDYLQSFPSRYSSLSEVSRDFVRFLRQSTSSTVLPFVPDLAALEWEKLLSRHHRWRDPESYETLLSIPEEDLPDLQLQLQPSARLLRVGHRVHDLHEKSAIAEETFLLLVESPDDSKIIELSEPQFDILCRIQESETVGQILSALEPEALTQIPRCFKTWASQGLFATSALRK